MKKTDQYTTARHYTNTHLTQDNKKQQQIMKKQCTTIQTRTIYIHQNATKPTTT